MLEDHMVISPRCSVGPSPARAAASVRRTSSIDVRWPDGYGGDTRYTGRARDILTHETNDEPVVLAEDSFEALFRPDRTIAAFTASPSRDGLAHFLGQSSSRGFRKLVQQALPREVAETTPLYRLLDDIPGTGVVATVAWSQWDPDWKARAFGDLPIEALLKARRDVCIANAEGATAQNPAQAGGDLTRPCAKDLVRADDRAGWHRMEVQHGVAFRRVRRIDVSLGEHLTIDAEFQDSTTRPDGTRAAIHEYGLTVLAHPGSLAVLSIRTEPRVLPYRECSSVSDNLSPLLGVHLCDLRRTVPIVLAGAAGCTHLNDALRALAEVPPLLRHLAQH